MATNTDGGTTASLDNAPQAKADTFYKDEDLSGIALLDVMLNDLAGNAKILWSVDDSATDAEKSLDLIPSDIGKVEATTCDRSAHGAKIWIVDGKVAYQADSLDADFKASLQALAVGQTLTDSFTYAIRMSNGTLSWNTATIVYDGKNDPPVANADTNGADAVTESGVYPGNTPFPGDPSAAGNVLANDTDIDNNATLTVKDVNGSTANVGNAVSGTYGSVTIAADGSWTYTLDNTDTDTQKLAQGQTVTEVFNYTVKDEHGATSTSTLTITITGTNDGPVANADVNGADVVTESGVNPGDTVFAGDASASGNVLSNDTDIDTGAVLTVKDVDGSAGNVGNAVEGTYGSVTLNADGTWTYSLNNGDTDTQKLAQGATATETFNYTVKDQHGATSSSTLTITITGTNDAPVANVDGNGSDAVTESGVNPGNTPFPGDPSASGNVLTNDTDIDTGAALTVADVNGSNANVGASVAGTYGSVTIGSDGSWTYALDNLDSDTQKLAQGASVTDQFTYTVKDQHGATSTSTLTITITGTNDGPVANADTGGAGENQTILVNVLANDTDVDDGAVLSLVSASAPAGKGSASIVAGQVEFNPGADFDHLAQGATEVVTVNYTMKDEHDATSSSTIAITVTGTNDTPVATADANDDDAVTESGVNPGNTPFPGDASASGNVLANDTDVDDGAMLTVKDVDGAPGNVGNAVSGTYGSVTIAENGSWTYTLDNLDTDTQELAQGQSVTEVFNYTVKDQYGATSTSTLTITITGTNDAPALSASLVEHTY